MFKFIAAQYLKAFFQSGAVQIGTLHDFRTREGMGALGDRSDGSVQAVLNTNLPTSSWTPNQKAWANGIIKVSGGKQIHIRGMTLQHSYPNVFAFCGARAMTPGVISSMLADGQDECYLIKDEEGFMRAIAAELNNNGFDVTRFSARDITYHARGGADIVPFVPPSPFDKPAGVPGRPNCFADQNERRFAWWCSPAVPEPLNSEGDKKIVVHVPGALRFVQRIPRRKWETLCQE
jgi:hypothetical protein